MTSFALLGLTHVALVAGTSIKVSWLEGAPKINTGTTFGIPWARGQHLANATTFTTDSGDLQSWVTAYWPDGSIKWSGHALAASESAANAYTITASGPGNSTLTGQRRQIDKQSAIKVEDTARDIIVNTGKITASCPKTGNVLVSEIKSEGGKTVGKNGRLILNSQDGIPEYGETTEIKYFKLTSKIYNTTISEDNTARTVVTIQGIHSADKNSTATRDDWLPFTVRFYLYADSEAIRTVHTIVYDGDSKSDFISLGTSLWNL